MTMKRAGKTAWRPGNGKSEKEPAIFAVTQAEHLQKRQLERSISWTSGEWLRWLWYRLRLAVQEMNYASKRMIELQMRLPDEWRQPQRGQRTGGPALGSLDSDDRPRRPSSPCEPLQ
jgi:hypothetical protein